MTFPDSLACASELRTNSISSTLNNTSVDGSCLENQLSAQNPGLVESSGIANSMEPTGFGMCDTTRYPSLIAANTLDVSQIFPGNGMIRFIICLSSRYGYNTRGQSVHV